jgi:hypothetical protein
LPAELALEIPTQAEADLTADAELSADPVQTHLAVRINQGRPTIQHNQKQARGGNAPAGIIMKRSIGKRIGVVIGCVLATSASSTAWAKAVLTGLVVLEREHGAPLEGVAVSAPGANQDASHSDGTFKLEFPKYEPGDEARLIVTRPGWVVVNEFQLQRPLPKPHAAPLEIIICKAPDREKFALVLYRLKGTQAVEEAYRRKLAELEKKTRSTAADLGPVNTYAITATAIANRQCNEEGAAKGGSLGAMTEAAMAVHGPVPKGYGPKSALRRCEPWPWNHQGQRLAPRSELP